MNPEISEGDIVRLTNLNGATNVLKSFANQNLTVTSAKNGGISFKENADTAHYAGAYFAWRFTKVADAPKVSAARPNKQPDRTHAAKSVKIVIAPRDKSGRFISPKNTVKPTALRPGALYMVKRKRKNELAHLRKVVVEKNGKQTLVMSRHGEVFLAQRNKVTLASDAQVHSYLKEAKANK